jgi:ABC-type branched-subunit amino acid transport system permease subunit
MGDRIRRAAFRMFVLSAALFALAGAVFASTTVAGGTISLDTTWIAAGAPRSGARRSATSGPGSR